MCGVRYEGPPGRLWAGYSCQLMSDTLLTDLSIHIHDNTLGQDILRCTNWCVGWSVHWAWPCSCGFFTCLFARSKPICQVHPQITAISGFPWNWKTLHGNREIAGQWAVGVWEHRDIWLGDKCFPVLEPNTNAQRLSSPSRLLCSPCHTLAQSCYNFLHSLL